MSKLKMVYQYGNLADPSKLPAANDEIKFVFGGQIGEQKFYKDCGHTDYIIDSLEVYGEKLPPPKYDKCSDCIREDIKKEIIRCVACGLPILPGDAVALYSGGKYKTVATKIDSLYIACLRWDCCVCGGFMCGNWLGSKGYKSKFDSRYEENQIVQPTPVKKSILKRIINCGRKYFISN